MTPDMILGESVIVQGITGAHGSFHTLAMLTAGTHIVAGTSPNKSGTFVHDIPVFASITEIKAARVDVDTSVIFVPTPFARAAIMEAIDAGVKLIVCITEGIPIHDAILLKSAADAAGAHIVGPNCPGILMPGEIKLGIIPANMGRPGRTAIVSRSGTLTYEAMAGVSDAGIGQRYIIGIGGDRIKGVGFIDCLRLFEDDPEVDTIVLIGEIGGTSEHAAAKYIAEHITKPVFAYVAGHEAPLNVQLGHAGAILKTADESARAKTEALARAGAHTADSITELIRLVASA